jgi:DNA repair exonuclease SbcCD ATPase subunit
MVREYRGLTKVREAKMSKMSAKKIERKLERLRNEQEYYQHEVKRIKADANFTRRFKSYSEWWLERILKEMAEWEERLEVWKERERSGHWFIKAGAKAYMDVLKKKGKRG